MSGRPGSSGAPPGTGARRPGSGAARPPGTSRLRTGVTPSGPGKEAAQGASIQAAINVSDRPLTGQGVMGMKHKAQGDRMVFDASHYVGQIRRRITDLNNETSKLRAETDQITKDNSQYSQFEKKYEALIKSKDSLEGQLADYNLAMDKARTSTDPDEVLQLAHHLADKNRHGSQELDRVFMVRKQREGEVAGLEEQLEAHYRAIQARINELEPGKLRAYNDLMAKQREYQEKTQHSEHKLNELTARLRQLEADDKGSSLRKEYVALEKAIQGKKRELQTAQEELDIVNLEPKEAHSRYVARVNEFKQAAKTADERINQGKEETARIKKALAELNSSASETPDNGDAAKYELLQKRDQDMTAFMDKFDDSRNSLLEDMAAARKSVVGVLQHIGRGLEDQTNMLTPEGLDELTSVNDFKTKNLASAQQTMESLRAEHKKRQRELELLKTSEPKFMKELSSLKETIRRMRGEIEEFSDIDGLRRRYDKTQGKLQDLKRSYIKRRDAMRAQVQSVSAENESLKRSLAGNDTFKDLEDTEKRLKQYERTIFELKEFVETKSRETNYEPLKGSCLKVGDALNAIAIKKSLDNLGASARK